MSIKTERIELRLTADTVARLDEWRLMQDGQPTRSEAVRRLLDDKLEEHARGGFRLNNTDRLLIWMVSEVLKHQIQQNPDSGASSEMETVDLIQQAIYGGHFWALNWELTGVTHDHTVDPKKVREVVDILDMWDFIEDAYRNYSDEQKAKIEAAVGAFGKNPQFLGFDGNNETEHMSIARFLVQKLGRFQRFKEREFNSHFPSVARYLRMAHAFQDIRKNLIGRGISPDELISLLRLQAE
jgi:Uncharacterized conserved protein